MGLRQSRLLEADESGIISNRGKELHEAWTQKRDATIAAGSEPTLRVATATGLAHSSNANSAVDDEIRIEQTKHDAKRPGRAAFGQLVHETILRVPFNASRDEIHRAANYVARVIGAGDADSDAATIAVERALASPIMKAAAKSARAHREYPILFKLDDGTLVEGIADLAFESFSNGATHWTIVDFKTDRDLTPYLDQYRAQLRLYIQGLHKATNAPVTGVILWL
jgi:ATP-dependent exoDNAse (exonuclease V) beta subunit